MSAEGLVARLEGTGQTSVRASPGDSGWKGGGTGGGSDDIMDLMQRANIPRFWGAGFLSVRELEI